MCGAVCHFVVEQVFGGAFEDAMRWCACALMEAGCYLLISASVCSLTRILPWRGYEKMQDEVNTPVKDFIGFGSWSAVHSVGAEGTLHGGKSSVECMT